MLDSIGKKQHSNAIVVSYRGHSEHRRELARQLALESFHRAESLRTREVDNQHHGELALLYVPFDKWASHARRNVPVDRADFVTGLVFTHLRELHSLAFEHRSVFAGENGVD